MELWIRSQSRLSLVKITDVCIDYNNQKSIIANFRNLGNGDDDYFPLGEYDTEERTLEVLDEIQNILKPQLLIRRNDNNDKVLLGALQKGVTQKIDMEYKELSTYVYEMPKE